jgi:hypothetical protein
MTKKVDVSTSPMPLTNTMSIAKNNNEGVASRATSLHSQIEAIATSDERLDERVHQQAVSVSFMNESLKVLWMEIIEYEFS